MVAADVPILAIDPGSTESAWLILMNGKPVAFDITNNDQLCCMLAQPEEGFPWSQHLAIETLHVRGMPTAQEELDTQFWAGRIVEAYCGGRSHSQKERFTKMKRMDVKMHICGSSRAKDANIRAALIDRFGGKEATKKGGVLYGIKADLWSALAIGITYAETTP